MRALAALALALIACGRPAPAPTPVTVAPVVVAPVDAAVDAAAPLVLRRIAVVGASVSAGFTAPRIAEAMRAAGTIEVIDAADLWMFRDPDGGGARQLATAVAARPSLVVALDFLFWFAYQPGDRAARAASLERGLTLLATVDGPLAVGDLADMRGADPRMLPPASVPPADELAAMNARIAAWAAARPHTVVLPLAAWTAPLLAGAEVELAPGERIAASSLLFLDGLHPNPLGLWYLLGQLDGALERGFGIDAQALVFARP
jgi:hypothetical protein